MDHEISSLKVLDGGILYIRGSERHTPLISAYILLCNCILSGLVRITLHTSDLVPRPLLQITDIQPFPHGLTLPVPQLLRLSKNWLVEFPSISPISAIRYHSPSLSPRS
jgi:hypothetical protein